MPTLNAFFSSADVLEERWWLSVTRKKFKRTRSEQGSATPPWRKT